MKEMSNVDPSSIRFLYRMRDVGSSFELKVTDSNK